MNKIYFSLALLLLSHAVQSMEQQEKKVQNTQNPAAAILQLVVNDEQDKKNSTQTDTTPVKKIKAFDNPDIKAAMKRISFSFSSSNSTVENKKKNKLADNAFSKKPKRRRIEASEDSPLVIDENLFNNFIGETNEGNSTLYEPQKPIYHIGWPVALENNYQNRCFCNAATQAFYNLAPITAFMEKNSDLMSEQKTPLKYYGAFVKALESYHKTPESGTSAYYPALLEWYLTAYKRIWKKKGVSKEPNLWEQQDASELFQQGFYTWFDEMAKTNPSFPVELKNFFKCSFNEEIKLNGNAYFLGTHNEFDSIEVNFPETEKNTDLATLLRTHSQLSGETKYLSFKDNTFIQKDTDWVVDSTNLKWITDKKELDKQFTNYSLTDEKDRCFGVDANNKKLFEKIQSRTCIKNLGDCIVIHLKRFVFGSKRSDLVSVPHDLSLHEFLCDAEKKNKKPEEVTYTLVAAILHSGKSFQSGHYVTLINQLRGNTSGKEQWFLCNDENISAESFDNKSIQEKLAKEGYVLFYMQKDAVAKILAEQKKN